MLESSLPTAFSIIIWEKRKGSKYSTIIRFIFDVIIKQCRGLVLEAGALMCQVIKWKEIIRTAGELANIEIRDAEHTCFEALHVASILHGKQRLVSVSVFSFGCHIG